MRTKHKGKIDSIYFGLGGYKDSMLGLHICFSFDKHKFLCTSDATWDYHSVRSTSFSTWNESAVLSKYAYININISQLLHQANVRSINELKNKDVEIILDGGTQLFSWKLL